MPMIRPKAKAPSMNWSNQDNPNNRRSFTDNGGHKNPGFRFDGSGRSFQSESVDRHIKTDGAPHMRDGESHTKHLTNPGEHGIKGGGGGWFNDLKRSGHGGTGFLSRSSSKSPARKAASALIAKIPFDLARHIAAVYAQKSEAA